MKRARQELHPGEEISDEVDWKNCSRQVDLGSRGASASDFALEPDNMFVASTAHIASTKQVIKLSPFVDFLV